jgi:hypothetical protein
MVRVVRLAEAIPLPPKARERAARRHAELSGLLDAGLLPVALRKVTDELRYEAKQILNHRQEEADPVYRFLVTELLRLADLLPACRPVREQEGDER